MTSETWQSVDRYFEQQLVGEDDALRAAVAASAAAGLPPIQVTATQGKFLHVLIRALGARRILELGTLGGYSTIWMARAVPPDGRVISIEAEAKHAEVARANLARAGVADRAEVRVMRADEGLKQLAAERAAPFDLVFIDADKAGTAGYFRQSLELTRPGGVIIVDNVARKGALVDKNSPDEGVQGMRRFFEAAAAEPRVIGSALQTVGSKSYDGFAMLWVQK